MRIDPAHWQAVPGLPEVLAALPEARVVGGAVRDHLLGLPTNDVDLAVPFPPETTVERLKAAGLKAVPTGLAHGTITAVSGGRPFEVTTLRRDVATDGRHATVDFTDDWQADAARRDFTINALYADPAAGNLFDYFDGNADISARRVRFIGDALKRIAEDHLRILRFFRFHARFGAGVPDADGLAACAARANDLMALSRERVREELLKLLAVADPVPTLEVMFANGIFAPVLPELDAERLSGLAALIAVEPNPAPLRRLAALLSREAAEAVGARLRLSNAERKRLEAAVRPLDAAPDDPRALAYAEGREAAQDRLLLAGAADAAASLDGWRKPSFPAGGRDVMAAGVREGPEVARVLQAAEAQWVALGFPADRQVALDLVGSAVKTTGAGRAAIQPGIAAGDKASA